MTNEEEAWEKFLEAQAAAKVANQKMRDAKMLWRALAK